VVEILSVSYYSWREADGSVGPKTQVRWRDERGGLHITVLEGTIRDRARLEREVRARRPR